MPHEIVGELLIGGLELGLEAAGSSDNKKSGWGCLILTILLIALCVGIYYISTSEPTPPTKGLVTKKLPNDKMVIKTNKGEDVYSITHELYLNKKEGDSITLNN